MYYFRIMIRKRFRREKKQILKDDNTKSSKQKLLNE
jgi:hypothetical protein